MNQRKMVELYRPQVPQVPVTQLLPKLVPNQATQTTQALVHASVPYTGASTTRRGLGWQPSRNGINTNLVSSRDTLLARTRDASANNPSGASALDNFEAETIGNGMRPHWNLENEEIKRQIEAVWDMNMGRTVCDFDGRLNFYGIQALVAREIFDAGEVFLRFVNRPVSAGLKISFQMQILEAEQCPIWRTSTGPGYGALDGMPDTNTVRCGIEFDQENQRVAYHLYRAHPGETMFYPMTALQYMRIPSANMLHVYRMLRAGQLRGVPYLTPVLTLLHVLDKYLDASLAKKEIQAMFAAFLTKTAPDSSILPSVDNTGLPIGSSAGAQQQLPQGVGLSEIETGTIQELLPGESILFPNLPQENDLQVYAKLMFHRYAAALGLTYEGVTGDLEGTNLSSIRVGAQTSRRKLAQIQRFVFATQFCQPVAERWLREAVLSGALSLPGFASDPEQYYDISWRPSGFPYMDPQVESAADQNDVRCGFTSREAVVARRGDDSETVDAQNARDNERADRQKLVYDSDGRHTLKTGVAVSNDEDANDPTKPTQTRPQSQPAPGAGIGKGGDKGGGKSAKPKS